MTGEKVLGIGIAALVVLVCAYVLVEIFLWVLVGMALDVVLTFYSLYLGGGN